MHGLFPNFEIYPGWLMWMRVCLNQPKVDSVYGINVTNQDGFLVLF